MALSLEEREKITEMYTDIKWIRGAMKEQNDAISVLDERVDSLERWKFGVKSALSVFGLFTGYVIAKIHKFL